VKVELFSELNQHLHVTLFLPGAVPVALLFEATPTPSSRFTGGVAQEQSNP
jgi:hypothetical protein